MSWLNTLHVLCGLVILAEALNKLERTSPLAAGLTARQRCTAWLKAVAWGSLAIGGGGAVATPALQLQGTHWQQLADVCTAFGFVVLIIRTRVKEG